MKRGTQEKKGWTGGDPNALRNVIAVQLEAVMGDLQQRSDVVLVGDYERDRAACEEAIQKALAKLNEVGDNVDPKANEFDLAWAWWNLNEAYMRLARLTSRTHLARRRAELEAERAEKARRIAQA